MSSLKNNGAALFLLLLPSPQSLVEEQQSQLNQYECAAGQCVSELQKAQLQVQSLQAKIHESEANNMVKTHRNGIWFTGGRVYCKHT